MAGLCGILGGHMTLEDKRAALARMLATMRHRGDATTTQLDACDLVLALGEPDVSPDTTDAPCVHACTSDPFIMAMDALIVGRTMDDDALKTMAHDLAQDASACARSLRGYFALAHYDSQRHTLTLVRDGFGVKPLYYTQATDDGAFLFASELKALLAYPGFKRTFNVDALESYLVVEHRMTDEAFFKGVYALEPATILTYKDGQIRTTRYFDPQNASRQQSFDQAVDAIATVARSSADTYTQGLTHIDSLLSGGVDSSYIAGLIHPGRTYTIGYPRYGGLYDEAQYAAELARTLGAEHHVVTLESEAVLDHVEDISYQLDEPLGNLSTVSLYFLAKAVARDTHVVFSGEGADENFLGYLWYNETTKKKVWRAAPRSVKALAKGLATLFGRTALAKRITESMTPLEAKYFNWIVNFDHDDLTELLKPDARASVSLPDLVAPYYADCQSQDPVRRMQYLDFRTWLHRTGTHKAERMMAAHGVDLRMPFLDQEVFRVAATIPKQHLVRGGLTKVAFRDAAKRLVPAPSTARKKLGFPVPFRKWIDEPHFHEAMMSAFTSPTASLFFNTKVLCAMVRRHTENGEPLQRKLWTVYMFLTWYDTYFGTRADATRLRTS